MLGWAWIVIGVVSEQAFFVAIGFLARISGNTCLDPDDPWMRELIDEEGKQILFGLLFPIVIFWPILIAVVISWAIIGLVLVLPITVGERLAMIVLNFRGRGKRFVAHPNRGS